MKKLDRIDRRILEALQKDARISYVDLGELVGLSTSPCLERVKRLENDGYISGYTAILNPELMNAGLMVYVEINDNCLETYCVTYRVFVIPAPIL